MGHKQKETKNGLEKPIKDHNCRRTLSLEQQYTWKLSRKPDKRQPHISPFKIEILRTTKLKRNSVHIQIHTASAWKLKANDRDKDEVV